MRFDSNIRKESDILDELGSITSLKTIPTNMNKIMTDLSDPNADMQNIADLVMKDQVLTAKIIRVVNSPFIGLRREISSLKQAIVFLGLRRIRSLVLATLMIEQFDFPNPFISPQIFWSHALGCAQGAALITPDETSNNNDIYYVAGLVHDLGELILAQYFQPEFKAVYKLAKEKAISLYKAEAELLGVTHCEIGAKLARQWQFPPAFEQSIRFHHKPELAKENQFTVAVVNLSDILARLLGLNYDLYESMLLSIKDQPSFQIIADQFHSVSEMDLERFSWELMDQFKQIAKSVNDYFLTDEKPQGQ